MKFRKKPVVVEAFQFTAGRRLDNSEWPSWLNGAWQKESDVAGSFFCAPDGGEDVFIMTLEGVHKVTPGDFIIQGIKGELYPCKPDIFAATYDPLEEER